MGGSRFLVGGINDEVDKDKMMKAGRGVIIHD